MSECSSKIWLKWSLEVFKRKDVNIIIRTKRLLAFQKIFSDIKRKGNHKLLNNMKFLGVINTSCLITDPYWNCLFYPGKNQAEGIKLVISVLCPVCSKIWERISEATVVSNSFFELVGSGVVERATKTKMFMPHHE